MEPNWCSCFQLDHKVVWKCFLHIQPKQAQSQWVSVDSLVVHASPVNILVHTNWNWNRTQLKPLCPGCMLKATEPQHSHCQSVELRWKSVSWHTTRYSLPVTCSALKICFMAYNKMVITGHLQCTESLFHGLWPIVVQRENSTCLSFPVSASHSQSHFLSNASHSQSHFLSLHHTVRAISCLMHHTEPQVLWVWHCTEPL